MAEDFYSIVTDYGSQKQLNSIKNGTPFDVQEIALGDSGGSYYNPSPSQTVIHIPYKKELIKKALADEDFMVNSKCKVNDYFFK